MNTRIRGFSLLELVVVIAALGLLAGLVLPNFSNVMPYARDQAAIAKAVTLEQAMLTYYKRVSNAGTTWGAKDNAGRYGLLYAAGYLPGSPATLAGFQPKGYTFTLAGDLSQARVTITGPNGTIAH